jgi:hypothetical protein
VPLLYKLTGTDVAPPLSMFMGKSLNLEGAFKAIWPLLEEKIKNFETCEIFTSPKPREDRDIFERYWNLAGHTAVSYSLGYSASGHVPRSCILRELPDRGRPRVDRNILSVS